MARDGDRVDLRSIERIADRDSYGASSHPESRRFPYDSQCAAAALNHARCVLVPTE